VKLLLKHMPQNIIEFNFLGRKKYVEVSVEEV
jgi:hypothetical protein